MDLFEQTKKTKFRIEQKLHSLNPLLDVKFSETLSKDMLFYDEDDENAPRAVQNRRLIAGLWSDMRMQGTTQIERWSGRLEPSHHAILAEGLKMRARHGPTDFRVLWAAAKTVRKRIVERRIERIGHEAFYMELRQQLLLAIEQLAEYGLTEQSLPAIKDIEWLSSLAHRHQKSFGY